jgi:cytochrome c-type biogenesis protein CcmE
MGSRRKKRFRLAGVILILIGIGVGLIIYGLSQNVTFFYSPSDLKSNESAAFAIRLGGVVKKDSIQKISDNGQKNRPEYRFIITDYAHDIPVAFNGVPPDLFTDGESVIAYGDYDVDGGIFIADDILAKHDESYMPPEVADAIEKAGQNPRQLQDRKGKQGAGQ